MTMVIDNQSRHYGAMSYESWNSGHMHSHSHSPEFNNPWVTNSSNNASAAYPSMSKLENSRPTNISMPFSQLPVSAPSLASGSNYSTAGYGGSDLLSLSQDIPRSTYGTENSYTSTSSANNSYAPPQYSSLNYSQSMQQQQQQQHIARKLSNPIDNSRAAHASFGELDASRGMLALSHQNLADLTPRNIYEARNSRPAQDSYGFPSTHSAHSSISAASTRDYPYSYGGSIASTDSATDYSSAASENGYDAVAVSRTLPRPTQLVGANLANLGPPAPQSMMGQFSSKMSSNTQKKHKCKVCDKRFTRPSSLQTHMYSHTGEKPFACNVEGCGRHFSVVSNLRRHKKVHKGESVSSHSDDEE